MNLGSRLKQILDERGMTVTRFSKEAGIPAQTVYALINRDSNKADMDILMKLLTALVVAIFLAIPYWKGKYFSKPVKKGGNTNA